MKDVIILGTGGCAAEVTFYIEDNNSKVDLDQKINILGYILLLLSNPPSQIILVSAILFHTSICSSDFRIVDFFWNSEKENIMFTDIDEEITYLFSR